MESPTIQEQFVETGLKYAETMGYRNVPIKQICADHQRSHTLIFHYFGDAPSFHAAVLRLAIRKRRVSIVAQALAVRDEIAIRETPDDLKREAAESLLKLSA